MGDYGQPVTVPFCSSFFITLFACSSVLPLHGLPSFRKNLLHWGLSMGCTSWQELAPVWALCRPQLLQEIPPCYCFTCSAFPPLPLCVAFLPFLKYVIIVMPCHRAAPASPHKGHPCSQPTTKPLPCNTSSFFSFPFIFVVPLSLLPLPPPFSFIFSYLFSISLPFLSLLFPHSFFPLSPSSIPPPYNTLYL